MSLTTILGNAASGLQVSQAALGVVSDNIANVNTTGYVRKVADIGSEVVAGQGMGATVEQIARAADRFLQAASLKGSADAGAAGAGANILDQAQALFGDPTAPGSLFNSLDSIFSAFTSLAATPTDAGKAQAVSQMSAFLSQAAGVSSGLADLSTQTDQGIRGDVTAANTLLSQIDQLNGAISQASVAGGDATGAQDQQSRLIDQLSALLDVKASSTSQGGVVVRASDGTVLAGQGGAATLSYDGSGPNGVLSITNPQGVAQPLGARLTSGAIKGYLDLRDTGLPAVQAQLSELTSSTAEALNEAANGYSTAPPPTSLTGRNTGLDAATAAANFTGKTTVAITTASGALAHGVAIDFAAGTMSLDGGAATAFTPATFVSTLNAKLGPSGTAAFTNGALTLSASGSGGVLVQDDATTPASKAGRGFSAFFGLNDVVRSSAFSDYDTGLKATDASGFPPGQTLTLRLTSANGAELKDVTVSTPAGGQMSDLVAALNASSTGVGLYGAFVLDSQGALSFTANANSGVNLAVAQDKTANTATGASVSALFGIGTAARNARAGSFAVRGDIAADPTRLGLAQADLAVAPGQAVVATGDGAGADALSQASQTSRTFAAAGTVAATSGSLSSYAATVAAAIGRQAAAAGGASAQATAIKTEADTRRASSEGVNLDDELIKLTSYQQAYNASARVVQAAKDLYDTLLGIVQ